MEVPNGVQGSPMREKILTNITASILEKGFIVLGQFLAVVILVRGLAREDFGILGAMAAYFTFVQLINISAESVIFRDFHEHREDPGRALGTFTAFNALKAVLFLATGACLGHFLAIKTENLGFFWAALSFSVTLALDGLLGPFTMLANLHFKQGLATRLSILRYTVNVSLLLGLFFWKSLLFVLLKDIALAILVLYAWNSVSRKHFGVTLLQFRRNAPDLGLLRRAIFSYSMWTHLTGVVTNFVYKADTFFLSFFASLTVMGDYSVALSCANMAGIVPSILGQQNMIAVANARDSEEVNSHNGMFIRFSGYVGALTFLAYFTLGYPLLFLVTGRTGNSDIFFYMICNVTALIVVKTVASPLVAYINVKGSVRRLFLCVNLPLLIIAATTYYASARWAGARGVALANLFNAVAWLGLLSAEVSRYRLNLRTVLRFREDLALAQSLFRRLKGARS